MKFWMNLYRQGWYHREGKPGTLPWHPGDVYPTREAALADIDEAAPYIGTVSFELAGTDWAENLTGINLTPYSGCSVPIPLRETRKRFLAAEVTDTNPPWRQVGG